MYNLYTCISKADILFYLGKLFILERTSKVPLTRKKEYNLKTRLVALLAVLTIAVLSFGIYAATAQYQTQQTANVTVSSNGTAHVSSSSTVGNVAIDIVGAPGTTGSVSTATYAGNPQPGATQPANTTMSHYVVVTFNIPANKFTNATITITFTDADVAGMAKPYVLYKYDPVANKYNAITATVDYTAHTITAVVTSTTDPLFAVGGLIASNPTPSPTPKPTATPTPTVTPTTNPTNSPTSQPTNHPTNAPTATPTTAPTATPTTNPTATATPAPENQIPLSTYAIIIGVIAIVTAIIVVLGVTRMRRSAPKKAD